MMIAHNRQVISEADIQAAGEILCSDFLNQSRVVSAFESGIVLL